MFAKIILLSCLLLLASPSTALSAASESDKFAEILISYRQGAYLQAIEKLNKYRRDKQLAPIVNYWKGICYNRLQEFDKAIINFRRAIKKQANAKDLYYEYGQALYAANELKKAKKAFALSAKNNYKKASSLYYMADISQSLKQNPLALKYYKQIEKVEDVETSIQQAAQFKLGDILLERAEKSVKRIETVKKAVLPQYRKALKIDKKSSIANDIKRKIYEVEKKYELGPAKWANGRQIRKKKLSLYVKSKFAYDSNVLLEADKASVKAVNKNSNLIEGTAFGKYLFVLNKRFGVSPSLRLSKSKYTEDNEPSIFQNDSYAIVPKIQNRYEHIINGKPASILFDIDYNYRAQDRNQNKNLVMYSKTLTFVLGQKIRLLSFGDTTFKIKWKDLTSYTVANNSTSKILNITQAFALKNQHLLLVTVDADMTTVETDTSSTNDYLLQTNYMVPKLFELIRGSFGLSITMTDTKKQKANRGTEMTYAPFMRFSRIFWEKLETTLSYNFNKKTSKDEATYAYTQHIIGLTLKYNF